MSLAVFIYPKGITELQHSLESLSIAVSGGWNAPWPAWDRKYAVLIGPGYTPREHHLTMAGSRFHPDEYRVMYGTDKVDRQGIENTDVLVTGTTIELIGDDVVFTWPVAPAPITTINTDIYGVLIQLAQENVDYEDQTPIAYFYNDAGTALETDPDSPCTVYWKGTTAVPPGAAGTDGTIIEVTKV